MARSSGTLPIVLACYQSPLHFKPLPLFLTSVHLSPNQAHKNPTCVASCPSIITTLGEFLICWYLQSIFTVISLLILKDVAARGLDLPQVTWIVQVGLLCLCMRTYVLSSALLRWKPPSSPHPLSAVLLAFVLVPTGVRDLRVPDDRTRSQGWQSVFLLNNLSIVSSVIMFCWLGGNTSCSPPPREAKFCEALAVSFAVLCFWFSEIGGEAVPRGV